MTGGSESDSRAVVRAHQERILIERGRLIAWAMIIGVLVLWALGVIRPLPSTGAALPFLNGSELCILVVAVTQLHRPWCRRHILALSTAMGVQIAAFVVLYGLWTGNLWVLSLRLTTLNLVAAAVLPWGIAMQSIITATSMLGFGLVHWSVNGTLDHPSTIPTLVLFLFSLPLAFLLNKAEGDLAREIELRRTAENALRRATEHAKVAVWTSDLRTLKIRFASGWKRLLGRDEREITLAGLWNLVHPEDRDQATFAVQEHLQRRASTYETEQRMLHADGVYRWVLSRGLVDYDSDGHPHHLLGADIDISERKQLEEALRGSEEKYRHLVEDIGEIIFAVDAAGTVTYISPIAELVYGYSQSEIVGRPFADFVPAAEAPALRQAFMAALSGKPYLQDHHLATKSGDVRWVRNSTRVIVEDGQVAGLRGVLTDLTDRRRIERELQALTEELDARVIDRTRRLSEALDQRQRAEQALRRQSRRNQLLLQTASDGIHILDTRGRVVEVNAAFCAMLGYSAEELAHMWVGDWDAQWNERELQARISDLLEQPAVFESKHRRKDGTTIDVEISATAVDIDGETLLYASARDITQRKRAEERTATLLQITTQVAGTLDADALLDGAQRRVADVLRCDAAVTLLVDPARQVLRVASHHGVPPQWRASVTALEIPLDQRFGEAVASGQPLVINDFGSHDMLGEFAAQVPIGALAAVTMRVRGKYFGRLCAARGTGRPPFTDGDVALLGGIAQQLSIGLETSQLYEAQRAEATVSGALARLGHDLIANLNTPHLLDRLCALTTELLRCDVSSTFFRDSEKHEWKGAATFGNNTEFWELLHAVPIDEAAFADEVEQLDRDGIRQFEPADFARVLSPASALTLRSRLALVVFIALRRGDKLVGVQTAGWSSHTGRLSAEEERIARGIGQIASIAFDHFRIVSELERANRLKSDFMATMSHELRTPLNIIVGYNALLLDEMFGALTPDQTDTVQRVQKRAEELLELINATLDVSRLETGRSPLNLDDIDLGELLPPLVAEMVERYDKPAVAMLVELSPPLPCIRSDAPKLKLLMKNLLSNAMKFTAEGHVTVRVCPQAAGVEIAVTDSGIGIAPELLPIIFEPFRQGESGVTARYGGVGLGLYIVRRLVELLAGTVAVDSAVGRGSTFRVWLPLDAAATQTAYRATG